MSRDVIIFYETPYEVEQLKYRPPAAKTYQEEGKIMVAVLHTTPTSKEFGEPFILALTEEEASQPKSIERKICERLERYEGVGSKIWSQDALENSATDRRTSAAAKRRIDDDEDIDSSVQVVPSGASTAQTGSNGPASSRLMDASIARITLSTSTRIQRPFVDASWSNRYSLEDRYRHVNRVEPDESAKLPGAFGPDETEELYAKSDSEDNADQPAGEVDKKPHEHHTSILLVGELVHVEWDEDFARAAFQKDMRGKRIDGFEHMSSQERISAPSILERKRQGASRCEKPDVTVEQLLDEFVKEEKLTEDNMWYCPSCKKHQEAQKKFDLWKMPDVLVIHLKRFSNERAFRDKIDTPIEYPLEGLDLTDRVEGKKTAQRLAEAGAPPSLLAPSGSGESLVYDLFAVDNHYGGRKCRAAHTVNLRSLTTVCSVGGGHYTCHAKNVNDGNWYYFDDVCPNYYCPISGIVLMSAAMTESSVSRERREGED